MQSRTLISLFVLAIAAVAGVVLWWIPRRAEQARPVPVAVWVGIEVDDSGIARVGQHTLAAGVPFRLHAVVEARVGGEEGPGESVWYTEAAGVEFADGTSVAEASVRPWDQPTRAQIVWFSVEGNVPFLPLSADNRLEKFGLQEFSRPEWGRGWTVAGSLTSQGAGQIEGFAAERTFGTQRYQVWLELAEDERAIVPDRRIKSWGPEEVVPRGESFPSVIAQLEGPAAIPSSAFGLTQIEPAETTADDVRERIAELSRNRLAFTRLGLLRDALAARGLEYEELEWSLVELSARLSFDDFTPGDLLRVGSRWVFLLEDAGTVGVLDAQDLCMDFDAGAVVRPLGEVFVAEGEAGDVEWARL